MEELEKIYLERGKTVRISRFTRDNVFFHSFPLGSHANLNTHDAEYNSKTPIRSFLDYISREQPMLSVASVHSSGVQETTMTRFAGIILKEGKIYDASSEDMVSQAHQGKKTRFRGTANFDSRIPIDIRTEGATKAGYSHNEFIVGDYEIGGLYFDPNHLRIMSAENGLIKQDIVPQIAQEALERGLPLYEVTKNGFKQVDPKKYIKK